MAATADHYTLMRRLLGSPPPGKYWAPCDGRQTDRGYCVGALCPQCRGIGYELKEDEKQCKDQTSRS